MNRPRWFFRCVICDRIRRPGWYRTCRRCSLTLQEVDQ
jgi:hypothetical protein